MRNHIVMLLGIALTLPIAAGPASGANEKPRKPRPEVRELRQARTFSDVGEYSGVLGGTISFNGRQYRLAPDVTIYEVGRGLMAPGTTVSGRVMAISGVTLRNSEIVYQIIVRPAAGAASDAPIRAVPAGQSGPE